MRAIPAREARGLRAVSDGDWALVPLDRTPAERMRARLADAPRARLAALEVEILEGEGERYVLGGRFAALRRVALSRATPEPPSADALERLARAHDLRARAPAAGAALWVDGEAWPPSDEELAEAGPRRHRARLDAELGVAVDADPGPLSALPVYTLRREAAQVVDALAGGLFAHRYAALFERAPIAQGTSPLDDLGGGGACFVFARLWTPHATYGEGYAYALWLEPRALLRGDRFLLDGDHYGAHGALFGALDDERAIERIARGALHPCHELLFEDLVPASHLARVSCRSVAARDALLARLPEPLHARVLPVDPGLRAPPEPRGAAPWPSHGPEAPNHDTLGPEVE